MNINSLPDEVLEFILGYLPPYKDLNECSMVCKRWNDIAKRVLHRSKLNLEKGLFDYHLCWNSCAINEAQTQPQTNHKTSIIAGRFSHAVAVHENSMYIFGGGSSTSTTFNDLWRFDLSRRIWIRPITMGTYPSPKGSASMICYKNQLILFGGWRYPSFYPPHQPWCLFDELHSYDIYTNRWTAKFSTQSPPTMAGHSVTLHGDYMILFGGFQIHNDQNTSSNEIWSLDLKKFQWSKPRINNNKIKPAPRYGQFQFAIDDQHLLIMGGCGGVNNLFNDVWVLKMIGEIWEWSNIPIKNKKYAAAHMWSSPACRVGNKLVIVGPTPNIPPDFQINKPKQPLPPRNNLQQFIGMERHRFHENPNDINVRIVYQRRRGAPAAAAIDNIRPYPQNNNNFAANHNNIQNFNNNHNNNLNNNNNPQSPPPLQPPAVPGIVPHVLQQPQLPAIQPNDEVANRLQRNLALRSRERDPNLPLRFNEQQDNQILMAAFHVQQNVQNASRERHQERLRRLDEKLNQFKQIAIAEAAAAANLLINEQQQPTAKRIKSNLLGMFVCDITNILNNTEPFVEWLEYKNYGILSGAPERLVFSTLISGNGELILFGGVQKESLCETHHNVTNTLHILTPPKQVI